MTRRFRPATAFVAAVALAGCATPSSVRPESEQGPQGPLVQSILVADDARGRGTEGLAPLLEGLRTPDPAVRQLALRALGRMEVDSLVPTIAPLLADPDPGVRAEAANALGQAVLRGEPAAARAALVERLGTEPHSWVRGVIGQTLGRLRRTTPAAATETARTLAAIDVADDSAFVALAKGFFFLARQQPARGALPADVQAVMRELPDHRFVDFDQAARARTMIVAALAAARAATTNDLAQALRDPHPLVRREAAAALPLLADTAAAVRLAGEALRDDAGVVRADALRSYTRLSPGTCVGVRGALDDPEAHVALLAIDAAPTACRIDPGTRDGLVALTRGIGAAGDAWHRAAHALVALARLQPEAARAHLPAFAGHANPFVRAYAARAADTLRAVETLRTLADDPDPNVRTAAIEGLVRHIGHEGDDVYLAQLASDDSQLLMAAATALDGSTHTGATPALLDALDRVTRMRRETSRDARVAILRRVQQLGSASLAARVRPYLSDFDPAVAAAAADALGAWTGQRPAPTPAPLPLAPVPTPTELDSLARAEVVLTMRGDEPIVLRLRPWLAPTNAARFARLAAAGYYDGLTFHRIATNFVVQGGSPHANEYAGDGPYTRDGLGIDGNWRGTVGLSTRGRDTGDAQIYINIIDNIRLDHEYTVFAEVVDGMDVVDQLMEGAVIESITVR